MKYDSEIIFANALPDAPLPMPKQNLERPRFFFSLRNVLASFPWL